jgi:LysM repeat protein
MKASTSATSLTQLLGLPICMSFLSVGLAQPSVPQAGAGMNYYPPGAVQPPAYQMPVAPKAPTPPAGFAPMGYYPPVMSQPKEKAKTVQRKSTPNVSKSNYRPPAGKASAAQLKGGASSSLESRVGKLESSDRRQDLRLGRLERDVGLLPSSEGGGVADIVQAGAKSHTVRPGDTLFSIASRHGTSVGELRALNHLRDDDLNIGMTLLLPDGGRGPGSLNSAATVHVVSSQENMASIARAYGVAEDTIARANPSAYASDLRPGERLVIPNPRRLPSSSSPNFQGGAGTTSTTATSNGSHVVKKGEMLGRIASSHGISLSKLMAANGIKNPNKIVIGQRLIIPGQKPLRTNPQPPLPQADTDTTPLPNLRLAEAERTPPQPTPAPYRTTSLQAPLPPIEPMVSPAPSKLVQESPMPRGIVSYRSLRGDTIESIASLFSTTEVNIRAINKFSADRQIKEGEELFVPTVGAVSVN